MNPLEQTAPLPPPKRLALAYAPAGARSAWAALLSLDERLEHAALGVREPMIGQIKLAWWRDRFREPVERWPLGEPLLALLQPWEAERGALVALVDGWERLVDGDATGEDIGGLIEARAGVIAALARLLGRGSLAEQAREAAREWAALDLAERLGVAEARELARGPNVSRPRLPRPLRPIAVLAAAARPGGSGLGRLSRMIRVGILGS